MKQAFFLLFSLLASCTDLSPWKLDAITSGEKNFNAARLNYTANSNASPLRFEMIRVGNNIEAYLNLARYTFTPSEEGNFSIKTLFIIDGEQIEEHIPLLEGGMRLRIPKDTTQQITEALQKGEEVSIIIDDFKQTLSPEFFSKLYGKLTGSAIFFQNPIKGPLQ